MKVSARSEHPRGAAAVRRLRERARTYLAALRQDEVELSILLVDDRTMLRLNSAWRGRASATDVLSFPCRGPAAGRLLGDVVISLDTARRAARSAGRTLGGELDRYLAHGLLHLLGHDHHGAADARRMSTAENALVGKGMVSMAGAERGKARVPRGAKSGGHARRRAEAREAEPPGLATATGAGPRPGPKSPGRRGPPGGR